MKIKKLTALLLALLMLLSLTACSKEEPAFKRGTITDNIYTNEISGVTYTAPEGFTYYSDEQFAALYNTTPELLNTKNLDTIVYDMYCGNGEAKSSVNIIYENLTNIYGTYIDEESYLTLCEISLKATYEDMQGVRVTNIIGDTIEINGTDYEAIYFHIQLSGTKYYQAIVVKECGDYMMRCTAAAYSEVELEEILAGLEIA